MSRNPIFPLLLYPTEPDYHVYKWGLFSRRTWPASKITGSHSLSEIQLRPMFPTMTIEQPPAVPTLYHCPFFVSSIPYQILVELGVPSTEVEVVTLAPEELRTNLAIRKISPRMVVPVLALPSGECILEAGAISLYLLEEFDKAGKLHPLPGTPDRPRFLQGVVYTVAEAYNAVVPLFWALQGVPKEERDRSVIDPLVEKFNNIVVKHLEKQLDFGKKDYYLGAEFSAADIMFGWILKEGEDVLVSDVIESYAKRVGERNSYKKLFSLPSKE